MSKMVKISKTFHIRREALKLLYYLKADFMIKNHGNESNFWDEIFQYAYKKLEEVIVKDKKKIVVARISDKRVATGGYLNKELYYQLIEMGKKNKLKKYEIIELAIYFYALEHLKEDEQKFFNLERWGIIFMQKM
ncbi:hypothetical protein P9850_12305 [Anoxybacillus rupiensis]|uniref:Uncharacterized protein n=1 Tax=Anoxybacteroides rupiense TaxID=311460 RepID=A0ABD5IXX6_9BACL|nr:hypothetical protein [Anoxybacillus rupiensis]